MNPWHPVVDVVVKLIEKLAGFLLAFFMGRGYERNKQKKDTINAYSDREKTENDIARLDASDRKRMRDKWTRK